MSKGANRADIVNAIKTPLGLWALIALIVESVLLIIIGSIPDESKIYLSFLAILLLFFITFLAFSISKKDHVDDNFINIKGSEYDLDLVNLPTALNHLKGVIDENIQLGTSVEIKNFALDLGYTASWATLHLLNDDKIENLKYYGLVIDPESDHIKEYVGVDGGIRIESARDAIARITSYAKKEASKLRLRSITIEIKAYSLPPVIHGFTVNNQDLYLGFTEIENSRVEGAKYPYLYYKYDSNSNKNKHIFNVYNTWFNDTWIKSRTVFKFDSDGMVSKI